MQAQGEHEAIGEAARQYAEELTDWRKRRELSKRGLATLMNYDRSYVSQIEGCHLPPTEHFTRRAEAVLDTGGALWARWEVYENAKGRSSRMPLGWPVHQPRPLSEDRPGALTVEHDDAALHYDGKQYHLKMSRRLYNGSDSAITRYLIRVSVDRYPGDPERSNEHYRRNPLTFEELGLEAWCADEPMRWEPKLDRDAFKEAWLLFENDGTRFPLYPEQRTWIHYSYRIGDDKWGRWFQRAVRLPTYRLSVRLAFPAALQAAVWGTETSLTADQAPLRTPLQRTEMDDLTVLDWSTEQPALNARFRFEWKFRARPEAD